MVEGHRRPQDLRPGDPFSRGVVRHRPPVSFRLGCQADFIEELIAVQDPLGHPGRAAQAEARAGRHVRRLPGAALELKVVHGDEGQSLDMYDPDNGWRPWPKWSPP